MAVLAVDADLVFIAVAIGGPCVIGALALLGILAAFTAAENVGKKDKRNSRGGNDARL